jgi:sterol desaturase/sphingolipid hydroxylase (fatty acid hydroxylase superfamily)
MTNVPEHPSHPNPVRGWKTRLVHLGIAAVIVTISLATDASAPIPIMVLFALVVPFEKFFPRHQSQRVRRPGLTTDLAFALATPLLSVVGLVVALIAGVLSLVWLPGLALRPLVRALPIAVLPILGAVLFDLAGYWVHRLAHEKAALWRFHSVHHSGEQLDWLSGVRVHPLDGVLIGPPVLLLSAAGFPAEVTGGIAVAQLVIGLFLHANVRWHLRPLQRVIATPDFHHWHHANEPDAIHTNYAAFLPIWDQLFGTYRIPNDRQPSGYGINEPHPTDFVGLLSSPLRGLRRPRPLHWLRLVRSVGFRRRKRRPLL